MADNIPYPYEYINIYPNSSYILLFADCSKVFPHNLRHLFARTYYSLEKDLSRLADILGRSSVNTTPIL